MTTVLKFGKSWGGVGVVKIFLLEEKKQIEAHL